MRRSDRSMDIGGDPDVNPARETTSRIGREPTGQAVRELAAFLAEATADDLPEHTISRAERLFADTVGVALSGTRLSSVRDLISRTVSEGPSVVLDRRLQRVSEENAALLNAVAICSTEQDEGTRPTSHPAVHIVPPLLARAQALGTTGREFIAAITLGYEVQARIARGTGQLRSKIHCHGNFGHAAAAAALAKLEGLDSKDIATAINSAASFASSTSYSLPLSGATAHSVGPALSGVVAFIVLRLVRAGYTSFDDSVGEVFGEFLGEGFDPKALTSDLGKSWAIEDGYVKFYATCGHVHAVLDALRDALGGIQQEASAPYPWIVRLPFELDMIHRIDVRVSNRAAFLSGVPEATSSLAARFSIPLATAAFLVNGHACTEAFEEPLLSDRRVWSLAQYIHVQGDTRLDDLFPETPAEVTIHLRDHRIIRGYCSNPYGNPFNPANDTHVQQKFMRLASAVLPVNESLQLWESATTVSRASNMREFPRRGFA